MTLPYLRRQILGCSGGATAGLIIGAVAGANFSKGKLAGENPETESQHRPGAGSGVVRLFFNENPYGPPDRAKQAIRAAIDGSWKYSHQDVRLLRGVIAEREGLRPDTSLSPQARENC